MEEPGEQDTVVFALILPLACSVTIHAKTTVHCSPDSSMHSTVANDDISFGLLFFVFSMLEMERRMVLQIWIGEGLNRVLRQSRPVAI
jgi:hypothetical protein